jgi:hypothetical protein
VSDAEFLRMAPASLLAEVADLDELHALRSRFDPSAFCSYVLRDEETGGPIKLQPMHVEWHRLARAHKRLLIWAHVEAGKTQQIAVGRALWEMGRDPNLRIVIISNTFGLSTDVCISMQKYIQESPQFRKVFPGVARADDMPWTSTEFTIVRGGVAKDPSVRSMGVHGNILGARIDYLIIDDILDYENTLTQHQRDDLFAWFHATIETRLTRNARVICIGTAWNRDDLMHRFASRSDWKAVRYPVMDEVTHELNWPEKWSMQRIIEKRHALGPAEFNRALLCIARGDEESRFKKEWIDQCLKRGEGKTLTYGLQDVPDGYATFTGVDLGVRMDDGSDLTSMCTIIVHPNGDRELLDLTAGRWSGPQIVGKIIGLHKRYHSIVIVENNAAQEFIVQFTKNVSAVPVKSFTTTGKSINHPQFGLESMATEMSLGKWIIPNKGGKCHSQVQAWIDEMLYYDPMTHPGDRLMSSWFAKEGSRLSRPKARIGKLDLLSR